MGKSIKQAIKENEKETKMKTPIFKSTAAIVIYTVAATLFMVWGGYQIYLRGHADGVQFEKNYSAQVDQAVASKTEAVEQ